MAVQNPRSHTIQLRIWLHGSRSGIEELSHLQRTTVHHPAKPTVENLGMAVWSRSGIEELEPIYSHTYSWESGDGCMGPGVG
jgi:hypothetical protein